jgi:hypothetical protein
VQATNTSLANPRPAAALAFYHLVALLQQALALAILALLLLLDVGTFLTRHDVLQMRCDGPQDGAPRTNVLALTDGSVPVYKKDMTDLRTFMITRCAPQELTRPYPENDE